ncbi:carbohydrate kinase family protein [Bacillus suaedaesalsae]|uniref:Carbohydrate kinase family protein n=1 Tax=Bacillus suaedaesalsae TaxID=2810349 RepID=A0ABS2DFP7_9BACI|nr:carbohydrate kinase family protein [Bacillus suaedaesalsae]MBM6616378.1 carbohydrate kinase family protein [Bacillus suaedaesalsae]
MDNILVLGGVSFNLMVEVDHFPQPVAQTIHSVKSYHETLGSTGAGKSLNVKKLGFDVDFYGIIGKDEYGDKIVSYLKKDEIPFHYDISPDGTERHLNFMKNSTGERLSIFLNSIPNHIETNKVHVEKLIQKSDYVFLNIVSYCKDFIPLLKKHKKEIWVDLHDYDGKNEYHQDFIEVADVIQFSSENNPKYKETMKEFLLGGKKLIICTHGDKGATILSQAGWLETPAQKYNVVDTNGAGDAYFSGILYGITKGYELEKTARIASIVGGLAVTSKELALNDLSSDKVEEEYKRIYL